MLFKYFILLKVINFFKLNQENLEASFVIPTNLLHKIRFERSDSLKIW